MKKNICIATWFYSSNCGTCLQAKALYEAVDKKYNAKMLSYKRALSIFDFNDLSIIKNKIIKKLKKIKNKKNNELIISSERSRRINKFINQSFDFVDIPMRKEKIKLEEEMDCFIVGSDQLWNPFWYDERYYLDFVKDNNKKKSYATSIGISSIPSKMKKKMKKKLQSFSNITVRENIAKQLLEQLLDRKDIRVVSDPTFLLNSDEWRHIYKKNSDIEIKNNYLLCYFVGGISTHFEKIKKFAKNEKLKIVIIPMQKDDYNFSNIEIVEVAEAGPYEFLSLIDNAQFICTDSFHALTISLSFNKHFSVFERHKTKHGLSQSSRIEELLERYELKEAHNNLNSSFWENIDYEKINGKMFKERESSLEVLYNMIEDND